MSPLILCNLSTYLIYIKRCIYIYHYVLHFFMFNFHKAIQVYIYTQLSLNVLSFEICSQRVLTFDHISSETVFFESNKIKAKSY